MILEPSIYRKFLESPFYANKLKAYSEGLDLSDYPFTEKSELLKEQTENPPFGRVLACSREKLSRVHQSSGTTNKPLIVPLSRHDIDQTVDVGSRAFSHAGLTSSHTVIHCLNYCMWMGGYTDHESLEKTGATVIPFGVGHTERLVRTILDLQVDAIHCTPSYLQKIKAVCIDKFKLQPSALPLKLGLFGAEGGLSQPQYRARVEEEWGLKAMNANYGISDIFSLFGAEGVDQDGLKFMADQEMIVEILDIDGKVLPMSPGVQGEMVLTHINREAMPLLRYRTKDIIRVKSLIENSFNFDVIGRVDDMIVVGGVNIFLSQIHDVIQQFKGVTGEFRVFLKGQAPYAELEIQLEGRKVDLEKLEESFQDRLQCRPNISLVEPGFLPRTEGKSKRIVIS